MIRKTAVRICLALGFLAIFAPPVRALSPDPPSILLITVDTFRPDHLGCMGYPRPTTPNLDRIASEGVLFTQAISSSSWTMPGIMSALTGLYPPTHRVDERDRSLAPGAPTLPRLLRPYGYVSPDVPFLPGIPNFQGMGFDPYPRRDSLIAAGDAASANEERILFRCLEDYRDRRFFLYYHYRDLHLPYTSSAPYDTMFLPAGFDRSRVPAERWNAVTRDVMIPFGQVTFEKGDRAWIAGLYDGQLREMDERFFGKLDETLTRLGLREKTLLIVTADHGEEILDHGFVGHASTSLQGNSHDEVIRIPLIVRYPAGLPAGRRFEEQVRIVDIAPTVLDLLGALIPPVLQGRSLLPLIRGDGAWREEPAFCETAPGGFQATTEMRRTRVRVVRTREWKLIRTVGPSAEGSELYHLSADPGELRDVIGEHPDVARRMRAMLDRWVEETNQGKRREGLPRDTTLPPDPQSAIPNPQSRTPVRILYPAEGDTLRFDAARGTILPRWTGGDTTGFTVQYAVGAGTHHLEGEIAVTGVAPKYGPFGQGMWNTLALYNPWTFRVRRNDSPGAWSKWRTFHILPAGDASPSPSNRRDRATILSWLFRERAILLAGGLAVAGAIAGLLLLRRRRP